MTVQKIIVFDLDETLGHFVEIGVFLEAVREMYRYNDIMKRSSPPPSLFKKILDLFASFYLRPGILSILRYVKKKKEEGICSKVILYTKVK